MGGGFGNGSGMDGGVGRRQFLRLGGAVAAGLLVPDWARALATPSRSLGFYALHTGERLTVDYMVNGRYQPQGLDAIAHVLRDHRTDQVHPIDPAVLDILYVVRRTIGSRQPFNVISGYRSQATNDMKRRRRRRSGVAKNSYHIVGKAVDVYLPDRELRDLRQAALALRTGGVGYYPGSGFVHLDCGPVRTW